MDGVERRGWAISRSRMSMNLLNWIYMKNSRSKCHTCVYVATPQDASLPYHASVPDLSNEPWREAAILL